MKKLTTIIILILLTSCSNGQEHIEYYENGEIYKIGKIDKDSIPIGKWKVYDKDGELRAVVQYSKDGKRTGECKDYYGNGKLRLIQNYKKGIRSGKWKMFYENGQLEEIGTYKNNTLIGEWKEYYKNGKIKRDVQYSKEGYGEGEWKEYYENGKLQTIGSYKKAKKIGEWKRYHKNGQLAEIGMYENDREIGEYKLFFDNGELKISRNFKAGKAIGEWKEYYKNKEIKKIENYKEGRKTGEYKEYWSGEVLNIVGTYKNGEKTGEWKRYDSGGSLDAISYYNEGEKTGEWKEYYRNGKISQIGKYKHKKTGIWKKFYTDGGLFTIEQYDYGNRIGKRKRYENGKLVETENYGNISELLFKNNPSKLKLDTLITSFEKPLVYLAIKPNIFAAIQVYINDIRISPKAFMSGDANITTSSRISHYLKPGKNKIYFTAWSLYSTLIEEQDYNYDVGIELKVRDEVQGRSSEVVINKTKLSILDCKKISSTLSVGSQSKDVIRKVLSGYLNENKNMNVEKTKLSNEVINDNIIWTASYEFTWNLKNPAPKWATGETIKDNKETHREVFKTYEKIYKILQNENYEGWLKINEEKNKETAKLTYQPLEDIIRYDPYNKLIKSIIEDKAYDDHSLRPLDFKETSMEIIANGKLVRLYRKHKNSIIRYQDKENRGFGLEFYFRKQGNEWVISLNRGL